MFFYKYLKLPKTPVKRYLQKVGHGIMVLDPTTCKIKGVFTNIDLYPNISIVPVITKHLYNICTMSVQRLRRWSNIVQMLYKCFVFTVVMALYKHDWSYWTLTV